jgi:hypothetical protein
LLQPSKKGLYPNLVELDQQSYSIPSRPRHASEFTTLLTCSAKGSFWFDVGAIDKALPLTGGAMSPDAGMAIDMFSFPSRFCSTKNDGDSENRSGSLATSFILGNLVLRACPSAFLRQVVPQLHTIR